MPALQGYKTAPLDAPELAIHGLKARNSLTREIADTRASKSYGLLPPEVYGRTLFSCSKTTQDLAREILIQNCPILVSQETIQAMTDKPDDAFLADWYGRATDDQMKFFHERIEDALSAQRKEIDAITKDLHIRYFFSILRFVKNAPTSIDQQAALTKAGNLFCHPVHPFFLPKQDGIFLNRSRVILINEAQPLERIPYIYARELVRSMGGSAALLKKEERARGEDVLYPRQGLSIIDVAHNRSRFDGINDMVINYLVATIFPSLASQIPREQLRCAKKFVRSVGEQHVIGAYFSDFNPELPNLAYARFTQQRGNKSFEAIDSAIKGQKWDTVREAIPRLTVSEFLRRATTRQAVGKLLRSIFGDFSR